MLVSELIEILEGLGPNAAVWIAVQPTYPFEHSCAGICERRDFADSDDDDDEDLPPDTDRWSASESELPANDVLILAGDQVRYGNKDAWNAATRR